MLKLFKYFLVIFFAFAQTISAQECKCDEAKDLKEQYIVFLQQGKIDSAKIVLTTIKKLPSTSCKTLYYLYNAFVLFQERNYTKAKQDLNSAYVILQKNNCPKPAYINYYTTYALIYVDSDKLDSATIYFLDAIKICEETNTKDGLANNYMSIASVFGKLGQADNAILYIRKAIHLNYEIKDYLYLAKSYNKLSTAFSMKADTINGKVFLDSMNYALDKAFSSLKKSGNIKSISNLYYSKAELYKIKGNYKISKIYLDSCIRYGVKDMHEASKANWYLKKADINFILKEYDAGLISCDSALKYAEYVKSATTIIGIYKLKHKLYKAKGDFNNALLSHESMVQLSDSLNLKESSETINALEKEFNQVKNEKTINELNQQKEIDSLRIRSLVAFIGVALLIILVIIFFYRQSVTKNKLKTIEIEQRLNRARMDPHFFFNALTSLQGLANDDNRKKEVSDYISNFSKIMRQSLESTYTEMETLESEMDFLKNYLELQKLRTGNKFNYSFVFDNSLEINELLIPGMILQPFIENSIEHGFSGILEGGLISITFASNNKNLLITISDNGSGIKSDEKHKGYPSRATQIISDRLYLLNKKHKTNATFVLAENKTGIGTKVEITLPIIT